MFKLALLIIASLALAESAVLKSKAEFPIRATAKIEGGSVTPSGIVSNLTGTLKFEQFSEKGGVFVSVDLAFDSTDFDRTLFRGIHVHTNPIMDKKCGTAGGHWNPRHVTHGLLNSLIHHAGDMGNFLYSPEGKARAEVRSFDLSLFGKESIIGRSVVVHENMDDGGLGHAPSSKKSGNAGSKIACGTIVEDY